MSPADEDQVREILRTAHTVAVVGLSDKPDRDSYHVAGYLQRHGYRVIPVNPEVQEVLGEKAYAALQDVPEPIDVVNVFRRAEFVPEIAAAAAAVGARVLWLQEGVVHPAAAAAARAAGLQVVMDRCILKEHHKVSRGRPPRHPRTA
jgi:predicted CoA-binding protein